MKMVEIKPAAPNNKLTMYANLYDLNHGIMIAQITEPNAWIAKTTPTQFPAV